ncbi:MAG: hypothetical protein IT371_22390 [Deltaproteobacteria bacterium]|nr:hypothetical protein [Deltaproteobacteria bacterium]
MARHTLRWPGAALALLGFASLLGGGRALARGPAEQRGEAFLGAERAAAFQRAFGQLSDAQVVALATGDHVRRVEEAGRRAVGAIPQAVGLGWLRRAVQHEATNATIGALLTRAPNTAAILELGRRGVLEALPLLERIARGQQPVHEGGAVMRTVGETTPRQAAILAVAMLRGEEALPLLKELLSQNPERTVIGAIGRIGGTRATVVLDEALARADVFTKYSLYGELARLDNPKGWRGLVAALDDPGLGNESGFYVLAGLGLPLLKQTVRSNPLPEARQAAIRALGGYQQWADHQADPHSFKSELQHAAIKDLDARNRSKAIKFVGRLFGAGAVVEAFATVVPEAQLGSVRQLASQVTAADYQTSSAAREQLSRLAGSFFGAPR